MNVISPVRSPFAMAQVSDLRTEKTFMRETLEIMRIPSDPRQIVRIESYIHRLTAESGIDEEKFGNVLVSLTEAVNNAIIHGNKEDQEKDIEIFCERTFNALSITIKDQGPGFDYESLPDPTLPENVLKPGGRGVYMMRMLTDDIMFEDNGSKVTLCFRI